MTNEQKKKFNKTNSVSYNKLKQKMKKYLQTTGPADNNYEQLLLCLAAARAGGYASSPQTGYRPARWWYCLP